tara:strand:+ start:1518 stop:2291 length:774 start_codon:yes stop_codon:yes gene_type:complete
MIKNSYIYDGTVIHKRFKPKKHYFKYSVFSLLIDLDEIDLIAKKIKFFSYNKFNLISFFDKDHGPRDGTSLKSWVSENLKKLNIYDDNIKIKLLCYPRMFGYVFNPLSIFFVYNKNYELISILYEVKNTFGEQHTYIFKTDNENLIKNKCLKKFYVSPFIEMKCKYFFRILKPGNKLSVVIDQYEDNNKLLFASQDGIAKEFTTKNLALSFLSHPLMSIKVIGAIHFEALRLWLKGIKLVKKNIKIFNTSSIEKNEP